MEMQAEINALQEALSEATQRAVAAEEELARLRSILQDREAGGALKMTETEMYQREVERERNGRLMAACLLKWQKMDF